MGHSARLLYGSEWIYQSSLSEGIKEFAQAAEK